MKIINEPVRDMFFEFASKASKSIKLCAPYIKHSIVDELYRVKAPNCHLSVITKINLMNFYKNASDISAIRAIQENRGEVYNFQSLHAKFYIFDDKFTIITSANLTSSGFSRNYEYGVLIDESNLVMQTCEDFVSLCTNESTGKLNIEHSNQIENILNTIPKALNITMPKLELDYDETTDAIFDKDLKYIINNLSGWKKATFSELEALDKQVFTTSDFHLIIPSLKKQYIKNNNIEAKIRQQLQMLRDLGLVKFEGNGMYKKLWK